MGKNLTKDFYREKPLKDFKCFYGWAPYFRYGASTVTGWRKSQEDRIACSPGFYDDYSCFAVYDGHGGQEVAEYLKKNLHIQLMETLKESKDVEMSLYLSFLKSDFTLQNITEKEFLPIKEAVDTEFEIEDASTLSKKPEFKDTVSNEVKKFLQERQLKGECSSTSSHSCVKSLIASSSTMQRLFFEPIPDNEDDDDDYNIEEDTIETDSSPEDSEEDFAADDSEMITVQNSEPDDESNLSTGAFAANSSEIMEDSEAPDELKVSGKNSKEDDSKQSDNEICIEKDDEDDNMDMFCDDDDISDEVETVLKASNAENAALDNTKPLVGLYTGSTAVVLLLTKERLYVANVGDSKCVACVNGMAVDMTINHLPTDPEEFSRIIAAGHDVKDGRIDGGLNMSRAFGDFVLKRSHSQDASDAVICHPFINSLDISDGLEFIILASDGIWNELGSQDVINFIKERMEDEDPQDICTELFELLIPPSEVTDDGSGCDNMSAIIIFFEKSELKSYIERSEMMRYSYPKEGMNKKEKMGAPADTAVVEQKIHSNQKTNASCEETAVSNAPSSFERLMFSLADKPSPCQNPCPIDEKVIIEIDLTVSSDEEQPALPSSEREAEGSSPPLEPLPFQAISKPPPADIEVEEELPATAKEESESSPLSTKEENEDAHPLSSGEEEGTIEE